MRVFKEFVYPGATVLLDIGTVISDALVLLLGTLFRLLLSFTFF